MATPSVLTVPSMYGDGILYSGPTVFGNEIITNGDFSQSGTVDATSWTLGWQSLDSGISIANSNLILARATGDCRAYATDGSSSTSVVTSGKRYKLTYTVTENSNNAALFYHTGAAYVSTSGGVGTHVAYYTAAGTIFILRNNTNNSTIKIDNVSLKEITQGSDFEFTRATTGTRINEEGYIEDVSYNLIEDSETFNGDWGLQTLALEVNKTMSPKNTLRGGLITTGALGPRLIRPNSLSLRIGQTYTFSVFVKKENTSSIRWIRLAHVSSSQTGAWFDLDNIVVGTVNSESATIVDAGNGWYRIANTFVAYQNSSFNSVFIAPSEGDGLTNAGATALSAFIWGAQVVKGDKTKDYLPTTDRLNLPRLNYPPYGGCPSVLAEPQRTNLVSHSNSVANALSGNTLLNLQINSSNNLSPEGINNAEEIEVIATAQPRVESVATSNTTVYSISVYVKKVTGDFFGIGFYQQDIGNQYAKFDLSTGTFIGVSSNGGFSQSATNIYNCEIIAHKNNWYRITCTILTGAAASKSGIKWLAMTAGTSASSFSTGVLNSKFLIYGRQVEQASYVTSLIHTSGSTVTRNEDKALYAGLGTTDTFNDSEGVLFIETKALFNNNDGRGISINAGNGNNRILISYPSSASSAILGYTQSTAGSGSSMSAVGIDTTQKHKAAIKYKLNNTSFWVDGVRIGLDTSVAMPVGLKQLDFTNGISAAAAKYRGNLNAIAVYKTALTDTELANLTSYNNHDLFIPYKSRMQMISADQELQCTEHDITRFL